MKNIIKAILITAIAAMVLTGCTMNTIRENVNSFIEENSTSVTNEEPVNSYEENNSNNEEANSNNEENSSINESKPENNSSEIKENASSTIIEEKPVSSSTNKAESSSTTKKEEKPVSSSTSSSSTNKPVSSSSNKPVENPVSSSSTNKPTSSSTTKIEEKPISSSSSSTIVEKPVEIPTHNCNIDGHIWNNSYTESSTENVDIVETHIVSNCGYDFDLAYRYFGVYDIEPSDYLGASFGEGSSKVKTTGIKTITRFIHECSECGYKEVYNTEETITPGDTWEFAIKPRSKYFPVIWYDINNIPNEVYEEMDAYNEYLRANGYI
ncbi:MAG: hypothetical protein ACI4JS_09790 [Oscillospiraceae bacterium]